MAWFDDEVFEQRRVRHITSIHIRNLDVSKHATTSASTSTIHRPRPRRTVSTASTSSVTTIRRAPSLRGTPSKSRARASSIASTHNFVPGYSDLDEQFHSDLADLRKQVEEKLRYTFVTLSRIDDGKELYRTPISNEAGVHFDWGRTPGSSSDASGLPLHLLAGEEGTLDSMRVTVWYQRQWSNSKGKDKEETSSRDVFIELGTEIEQGWSVGYECNVDFKELRYIANDLTGSDLAYSSNSLLFGLASNFARNLSDDGGEEIPVDGAKDILAKEKKKSASISKDSQTRYYLVSKASKHPARNVIKGETTADLAEDKAAIRAMLKEGTMVRGYDIEDILRLLQLQRELCSLVTAVTTAASQSDQLLQHDNGIIKFAFYCDEKAERISVLKQEEDHIQEKVKMKKKLIQERIEAVNRRKARLEIARRTMTKEKVQYASMQEKQIQLQRQCESIRSKSYARRVTLLQQLEFIYPVELVDGAKLLFSIVGVPLANRVVEDEVVIKQGEEDDIVSSALGLIGQVIVLLSGYLDTPIHYSIITAGSRSIIQDSISVMSGPRAFPLYSRGVESYRFEYAIFLLNKDIEQLMNHFSITVLDIRNTLPNLKNLLVTLSASSLPQSRLSRRNLIGNETISLKADVKRASTPVQVVNTMRQQPDLNGEKQSQKGAAPTWGMSLLGWGSVKGQQTHSAHITSANSTTHLPTVRTLGNTST